MVSNFQATKFIISNFFINKFSKHKLSSINIVVKSSLNFSDDTGQNLFIDYTVVQFTFSPSTDISLIVVLKSDLLLKASTTYSINSVLAGVLADQVLSR